MFTGYSSIYLVLFNYCGLICFAFCLFFCLSTPLLPALVLPHRHLPVAHIKVSFITILLWAYPDFMIVRSDQNELHRPQGLADASGFSVSMCSCNLVMYLYVLFAPTLFVVQSCNCLRPGKVARPFPIPVVDSDESWDTCSEWGTVAPIIHFTALGSPWGLFFLRTQKISYLARHPTDHWI